MKLLVIESPGKIHTLSKILGKDYIVLATVGHMRSINDSGAYKTGIDCKNGFKVDYKYDSSKKDNIKKIKEAAKDAEKIIIATDPDREGHGIAEEVVDILKNYKGKIIRTTFNEITEKAVKAAIAKPSGFDKKMAEASEARNILDKLVGYRTSNIVLSKMGAPSAGRVQSALLRLLAEKEEQIQKFKAVTYYDVFADIKKGKSISTAKLFQIKTKKVDKITDKNIAETAVKDCEAGNFRVDEIKEKSKEIEPKLPLTTAAMQQLASNLLSFAPARTQKAAQKLYEKGYITYIRSDSTRFSDDFLDLAKKHIEENYGKEYYRGLNVPADKNKNAQDGHESIHQTNLDNTPAKVSQLVDADEAKLYKLIYNYSLASLFVPAKVKDTDVIIKNGDYKFKLSGRQVIYESFLVLTNDLDDVTKLPEFKNGDLLVCPQVYFEEKKTQPPQRYSEAGLVKLMESSGIGRPSTFSPTIETLKKREYIKIEKKAVHVTELGLKLNRMLTDHFEGMFESSYTATMEENLDKISNGEMTELTFLTNFWKEFEPIVLKAARDINKDKPEAQKAGKACPECGKELVYRTNKKGTQFLACSGFPRCKFTAVSLEAMEAKDPSKEIPCPLCGDGHMVQRKSKKGDIFWGCSRFSKGCKSTLNEEKMKEYLEKINENLYDPKINDKD